MLGAGVPFSYSFMTVPLKFSRHQIPDIPPPKRRLARQFATDVEGKMTWNGGRPNIVNCPHAQPFAPQKNTPPCKYSEIKSGIDLRIIGVKRVTKAPLVQPFS